MKWYLSFMLLLCMPFIYINHAHGQWNSPNRYRSSVFSNEEIQYLQNVAYTTNVYDAFKNAMVTLDFNIAGPYKNLDGVKKRPLVVMVHGGGFLQEPADKGMNKYNAEVMQLARLGYVVATINYRCYGSYEGSNPPFQTTWEYFRTDLKGGTNPKTCMSWYTAMQDLNAAIKFLCYNSNIYGIDTDNVFLFGESAGAITILTLATAKQEEIDEYFNFTQYLGSLKASTLPVCKSQGYTIKGVAPVAVGLPYDVFLDQEDQIPLLMESNLYDPLAKPFIGPNEFYYAGISGTGIINKIKQWSPSYPCSYFYFTEGGTYDDPLGTGYHTLNNNGWIFFKPRMAAFFADIIQNTTVCKPEDFSTIPNCHVYSSINPSPVVQFRTGLTDTDAAQLSVYPNPATDNITLNGLAEKSTVNITVYDGLGSLVKTYRVQTEAEERSTSLSLDGLAAGMYYLRIQDILNDSQFKILKQ